MGNACPQRSGANKTKEAIISAAEVRENGWLVIFGKVYNVKLSCKMSFLLNIRTYSMSYHLLSFLGCIFTGNALVFVSDLVWESECNGEFG